MVQFDHVDDSHRCLLVETFAGLTVKQEGMTEFRQACVVDVHIDLIHCCTVEDRSGKTHTQFFTGPSEGGFVDLTEVHTAWYAQRVQYDINRCSVFQERHVFLANDLGNDTLVTVATGHFISHFKLALHSEVNLGQLQYACGEFITDRDIKLLALVTAEFFVELDIVVMQ